MWVLFIYLFIKFYSTSFVYNLFSFILSSFQNCLTSLKYICFLNNIFSQGKVSVLTLLNPVISSLKATSEPFKTDLIIKSQIQQSLDLILKQLKLLCLCIMCKTDWERILTDMVKSCHQMLLVVESFLSEK